MAQKPAPMSIQFSHTSPQQNFRLLELPPELVGLLSAGDAPTLHLKSSAGARSKSSSSSPTQAAGDFLNLCTPNKTYAVRQVHSSNSIFLIRPLGSEDAPSTEGRREVGEVTAIGLCKSTLAVQPIKDAKVAVRQALRRALSEYGVDDAEADADMMDVELSDDQQEKTRTVMTRLFADVPFSMAECERAWLDACGFVHEKKETGELVCWRPTAHVQVSCWKKLLEAATLEGMNLGKQFLTRDLWRAMDGESSPPFPKSLFDAIVKRLMEEPSMDATNGIYDRVKWTNLDAEKMISWTGEVYLEATAPHPGSAVSRLSYLEGWKDMLPEELRKDASLDRIKGCYENLDAVNVHFKQTSAEQTKSKPAGKT